MADDVWTCPDCRTEYEYYGTRKNRDPRSTRYRSICDACIETVRAPKVSDFGVERNFKKAGTSSQAAQAAAESARMGDTHRKIAELLNERPMTGDECHQAWLAAGYHDTALNTIRARMNDLMKAGLIMETGQTRPTQYNRQASVMELSGAGMDWLQQQQRRVA